MGLTNERSNLGFVSPSSLFCMFLCNFFFLVFGMFYKASENSDGSGLGLYLVKKALEKLNGDMQITSEFESGTRVEIKVKGD